MPDPGEDRIAIFSSESVLYEIFFLLYGYFGMFVSDSALDKIDISILQALQTDGRLSNARLSEKLALSETPCWRRLKRLESEGFITGYQANVDRNKLGLGVLAFAQVRFGNHAGEAPVLFEQQVRNIPQILSCHNVTGEYDYLLQIVARDLEAYGKFIHDVLRRLPGVTAIQSNLSLREIKNSNRLPLG